MKADSRLNLAQGDSNMIPQASSQPIQKNGNNQSHQIKQGYCWLQLHWGVHTRFVKNIQEPENLLFLIGSDQKKTDRTAISWLKLGVTLLGPGAYMPSLPCFCEYLCKYTYEHVEKNLTCPNHKFEKGQYAWYPVKLSCFVVNHS